MDASSHSKRFNRIPTMGILVLLSLVLNACTWLNTSPKLETLTLAAQENQIALNTQLQITARADYANNTHKDVSKKVSWSSSNNSLASVDKSGLVSALAPGEVTITAKLKSISASYTITVSDATLSLIQVSPADMSIAKGFKQQYSATALLSDGSKQDISGQVSWLSTPTDIVSIDDNGLATAIATGTTAIVAQYANANGSALVTVTDASLQSILISVPAVKLPLGSSQQLTAFGIFSDGSKRDVSKEATWTTDDGSIANIEAGLLTSRAIGSVNITASLNDANFTQKIQISAATLHSLIIEPQQLSLATGLSEVMTATGIYSDGSQLDLTSQVEWISDESAIANIDNLNHPGTLLAKSSGSATITASLGEIHHSVAITVTAAVLNSISIDPAKFNIATGLSRQLSAFAVYSDGSHREVTNEVIWIADEATIISIDNNDDNAGLLFARKKGTTDIFAQLGDKIGRANVNVTEAKLSSLSITPLELSLANGHSQQYRVDGFFSDQTSQELTKNVIWSTADPTLASISNDIQKNEAGFLQTLSTGSTAILANYQGISAQAKLTVTDAVLEKIQIEPANAKIPKGTQLEFVATGFFSDGSHSRLDNVTWQSDQPVKASISTSGIERGIATANNEGSTTISATLGDIVASTTLNISSAVLQSIELSVEQIQLPLGLSQNVIATGIYSDNSRRDISSKVSWDSSNIGFATISNDSTHPGLMTAWSTGTVNITAQLGEATGTTSVTITEAVLLEITISAPITTLAKGTSVSLNATGILSDGHSLDLTQQVNWVSEDGGIASVGNLDSDKGRLQANAEGSTEILAIFNGKRASINFTITAATLDSIAISPIHTTLPAGATQQLTLTATYSDQSTQDLTDQTEATWSTDNTSASVGSSINPGFVTTLSNGTVTITASYDGKTATSKIDITDAILDSISISSPSDTLYQGLSLQLSAEGTYTDGTTQDISKTVTWSLNNASLASISNTPGKEGLLRGAGTTSGSIDVSASFNEISNSKTLAVVYDTSIPVSIVVAASPNIVLNSESHGYVIGLSGVDATATLTPQLVRLVLSQANTVIFDSYALTDNGGADYTTSTGLIITHPTDVIKNNGIVSVEVSIPGTGLVSKSSLYVTDTISDAIGTASSSNYQISADTVTSGSTFSFSIVNFSNRKFSLDSYEFTNGGTQIALTTDGVNLNNNRLDAGENITITTTLSAPQPAPFDFIGKYILTDDKTGISITVSQSFVVQ